MAAPTSAQLKRLEDTVAGFTSEPWQFSGHQAVLYVEVSPESGAWLFLRPEGEKAGKEVWVGEMVREWAKDPESRTEGSYDECLYWLRNRHRKLVARHNAISEIREFAEARKGWKFHDRESFDWKDGRSYAGRMFDYGKHGQVLLSVQPDHVPGSRTRLLGQINLQFSAGPEFTVTGDVAEVASWIDYWTCVLQIPLQLAESVTLRQARSLMETTSIKKLGELSFLLEIEGNASRIRVALIEMFVPPAVRNRYPS